MPYLTPNNAPGTTICRTIVIPNDLTWISIVNGALAELFKAYNFEQYGDLTPEETATAFYQMWSDWHESKCMVIPIGAMMFFPVKGSDLETGWLYCDGHEELRADYPALFAVIGTTFGSPSDGNHFKMPIAQSRFIRNTLDSAHVPGALGGAQTVTLGVNNLPAHHHAQRGFATGATTPVQAIGGARAGSLTTLNDTADTGSTAPFDILPPYIYLTLAIFAG